jgi:hypothetical protein
LLVLSRSYPFRFLYRILSLSSSSPPSVPPYRLTPLATPLSRHKAASKNSVGFTTFGIMI